MPAELKLMLATEQEPDLDGWSVAGGSWCTEHGIGVLLIVSPAEAERAKVSQQERGHRLALLQCVCEKLRRVLQRAFGVRTTVIAVPVPPTPPMDPARQ